MTDISGKITFGAAVREETVSFSPWNELKNNRAYAEYILFGNEESFFVAKPASLSAINADITRGALRADYAAALEADEYEGERVCKIALSADGKTPLFFAEFDPVVKTAGKTLSASVTVFANIDNDSDKILFGGDNPIARFLLGADSLDGPVTAAVGGCDRLNEYTFRPLSGEATFPASLSIDENGITAEASVGADAKELIVLVGGVPAIRVFLKNSTEMRIVNTAQVREGKFVALSYEDVASLAYLRSGVTNYADAVLVNGVGEAYKLFCPLGFYVGRSAEIKTDEVERYAAVGGDKEIMLISSAADAPSLALSVPRSEKDDFAVVLGGYLVRIGDKVTVFSASGSKEEYDVSRGDQNAIVKSGNAFYFVKAENAQVKRYLLFGGNVTELPALENLSGDVKIFRNMLKIGVLSGGDCYITDRYTGVDTTVSSARSEQLKSLVSRAGGVRNIAFGGGAFACFSSGGDSILYCVETGEERNFADKKIKLFGDFALVTGASGDADFCELIVFDRVNLSMRTVSGIKSVGEIRNAGRIGDFLIMVNAFGETQVYQLSRSGAYIYCPSATVGATVTAAVRVRVGAGKGRVKIYFERK